MKIRGNLSYGNKKIVINEENIEIQKNGNEIFIKIKGEKI